MKAIPRFELVVFASIFAVCPVRLHAQASALIERELVWSLPGTEIDSVKFSPDGNFIVLVNRAHWPDGHDAEGLPDAVFRNLAEKEKRNPRFADPVVKLIGLNGKVVCEAELVSEQRVLIFSHHWKTFSLHSGNYLPETVRQNTRKKSIYSPDLKYYLCPEPQ